MAHILTIKHFMNRLSLILLFSIFLVSGCINVPETMAVDGVEMKTHNSFSVTCKKPYQLTQDCSSASGATRVAIIAGTSIKLAGSVDGHIIMLMNNQTLKVDTGKLNKVAGEIKTIGQEKGFNLQATEVAVLAGEIESYFFIYDGDLYSQL